MNTNYSNVNFSSSYIPANKVPVAKVLNTVSPYFEIQGFGDRSVNMIRNKIHSSQVGVGLKKNEMVLVGKDRESDNFIAKMLKKNNIELKYIQDTPETNNKNNSININV